MNNEKKFNNAEKVNYEYKIRVIGSNISLDRFYSDIDPVSIIEELIKIALFLTKKQSLYGLREYYPVFHKMNWLNLDHYLLKILVKITY